MSQRAKKILVIAAHPDDEIIGVGGTLLKMCDEGKIVQVLTFSPGAGGTSPALPQAMQVEIVKVRKKEFDAVAKFLGFGHKQLGITEVIDRRKAVRRLIKEIRVAKPDIVFTHNPADRHHLHSEVSSCATEACWHSSQIYYTELGRPWRVNLIYFFEVWDLFSRPTLTVDVTPYFQKKLKAMKLYKSQLDAFPGLLDYLEALARVRGFSINVKYAEAFTQADILPAVI